MIETLIRNGASVNVRDDPKTSIDSSGYTPLHAAAWHGNMSAIDVLMKHGADVRARAKRSIAARRPDGPTTPVTKKPAT